MLDSNLNKKTLIENREKKILKIQKLSVSTSTIFKFKMTSFTFPKLQNIPDEFHKLNIIVNIS